MELLPLRRYICTFSIAHVIETIQIYEPSFSRDRDEPIEDLYYAFFQRCTA